MFSWFEKLIDPFKTVPLTRPPQKLLAFYWHYIGGVWWVFGLVLISGVVAALIEVALFTFVGQIVDFAKAAENPAAFFHDHGRTLIFMAIVALVIRPIAFTIHSLLINQSINANTQALVRWRQHRYTLRQSLSFFQNDFAGRIANRIMQTGQSLRQSAIDLVDALWYVAIYWLSAAVIFFDLDARLVIPLLLWLVGFGVMVWYFVPRLIRMAVTVSEARSTLMGRVTDSYANILTVKLFAHTASEEAYAKDAISDHLHKLQAQLRVITLFEMCQWVLTGLLIAGTTGLSLWLWSEGAVTLGAIAVTTGLAIRINNMSSWIMWVITTIFENVGTVEEGMRALSKPWNVVDAPDAKPLTVDKGAISYEHVQFHYGRGKGLIEDLSLRIKPGEKVGLVGRSGAGKSTLINILLRFHDLESGRILIDGQDISKVTQDSLRAKIGLVTQDTSLMHRSVADNIRYGRPDATMDDIVAAAKKAHAHDFIVDLQDSHGNKGYEAEVGERGVKLSGGQRQRIAIARVLLKDAPILILDEATAALDSEVEAAIQDQLYNLMEGKTVIAIAHRLSTISAMDRLIVMDKGHIVEDGTHKELLRDGGLYASLWARQSGGFLLEERESAEPIAEPGRYAAE
ncbi:ABC transporter related protein [Rhodomicrobium vannielii ATCC 17100]|uniref:ABC transporter related protein n=1 Tax=Rhodomicrobium vannielii (strain ATCC 17100 / DSM 162 / LMG 4299 / NCIMB 10020 / ATH 3.1.1) TaxID=648757 RepID=E3I624_RHOVT|nr:ABC transporter ATP-binding protein [Rhodomicrobium vannielii]ADP70617.1 ABC transporter related protein [Rhodomicrobium vannielii ATCC 17100]